MYLNPLSWSRIMVSSLGEPLKTDDSPVAVLDQDHVGQEKCSGWFGGFGG
jgi:hypothetical protein